MRTPPTFFLPERQKRVNEYFETLDELQEVLAKRCCFLQEDPQMRSDIRNLTNFHACL